MYCPINCNPAEFYAKTIYTEDEMKPNDKSKANKIYNAYLAYYKYEYEDLYEASGSRGARIKFIEK